MGYKQNIIVSSVLDPADRDSVILSSCNRWPFLRHPKQDNSFSDRLLIALPELTDSKYKDETSFEKAIEQNDIVVFGLPDWSQVYPDASFALVRVDCFGSTCLYDGFVCQAGEIIYETNASKDGHIQLLNQVDIDTNGIFNPFKRGYFDDPIA